LPSRWDSCLLLEDDGDPPPTLRKRPPEGQKEPKTISRARVLPIPGAVPAVFPASPSSRARVVLARVLPVPGALPAVFPASPSAPSPCCTRPCSAHPGRPSCRPPGQPFFREPSAPSPCCTGPCSARPGRPSCRPPGQPFFPEPVLYAPVFSCTSARTPARLLACSPVLRTPALPLARPPAWPACPPACIACIACIACAPARLHQPVSPVPCPARPPPVLACPPACLRSTCLRARPHTNVACPPLDRPTARRRRPALLPAARLPVRPPACLPPACSPAHPPACLPSVYEPHANADATRATLRPRWLHTPAPHPRPFPPCTAAPHHRRTAAYVRRGGRCVLWP
jgi:hypothetical protein